MENKELLLTGYKITNDPNFINTLFPIPKTLSGQLDGLHHLALNGEKISINKFQKLIDRYPKIPILKNYLSVSYQSMGNIQKAHEVNHWIIAEHPNYIYGKINLAAEYYFNGDYEKMADVLGKSMNIKEVLPERDTFHIAELTTFFYITALYFAGVGDFDQADIRIEILQEINPDHEKTEMAIAEVFAARIKATNILKEKNSENNITVKVKDTQLTEKTKMPDLVNMGVYLLYNNGTDIDSEYITKILSLPRNTLITDLQIVLNDSIERYSYFTNVMEDATSTVKDTSFAMHSLFFLAELEAKESLETILHFIKQDAKFFNFYLGDVLTEYLWIVLYKIEHNNLDPLYEFIQLPDVYTYIRTAISDVISQIALHQPKRRNEAIKWYRKTIIFFLNSKIKDNVIDSYLIGSIVSDITNIKGTELLPEIEDLYKNRLVDISVCGDFDSVKKHLLDDTRIYKREVLSINEIYDNINSWGQDTVNTFDDNTNNYFENKPLVKQNETRRNDPCPCGSGKKYKKCCMNK